MAKDKFPSYSIQELKRAIKDGNFARLYFFYGEEVFLLNYYLEQIKSRLVVDVTASFNYHKLTQENFDIRRFCEAVESLPMMAEHTFIWVDDIDIFKLNEDDRDKLQKTLSDIPEYCTVLFSYETVPFHPDSRYKKLYQAVLENGYPVEFPKQEQRDLLPWITRHFAANGKKIAPDLCCYLIELTGGTMTALAGDIAKISAYSGADTIVKSDIDAVVEPILEAVVFQMTALMGNGQYDKALVKLQQLLKLQEKPVAILGAIGNHLRQLAAGRVLTDSGENYLGFLRLYPKSGEYSAKKVMRQCRQFSPAFYARAAELILQTDRNLKTSYDDPSRLLEMLLMELSLEAKNAQN